MRIVKKVVGMVTLGRGESARLLILRHPIAGLQLPAGTVHIGENIELAVIRETKEESGLEDITLNQHLGHQLHQLPAGQAVIVATTKVFDAPSFDASTTGFHLKRGSPVKVISFDGKFAFIKGEALIYRDMTTGGLGEIQGFVRTSLLGEAIERHFFHLVFGGAEKGRWFHEADGWTFELFWTDLKSPPNLNPVQATWLDNYHEQLLDLVAQQG